jgi:hypothetical protein
LQRLDLVEQLDAASSACSAGKTSIVSPHAERAALEVLSLRVYCMRSAVRSRRAGQLVALRSVSIIWW